jgi:hypothetical protein
LIQLGTSESTVVAGGAVLLVLAIGAAFSVGAAKRGPEWARRQLKRGGVVSALLVVMAGAIIVLFRPVWVGLAVLYLALVVWFLSRTVSKRMELVGVVQVDPGYALAVVRRTRIGLMALAASLGVISVLAWGTVVSAVVGGIALVLGAASAALFVRRRDRSPISPSDQSI